MIKVSTDEINSFFILISYFTINLCVAKFPPCRETLRKYTPEFKL